MKLCICIEYVRLRERWEVAAQSENYLFHATLSTLQATVSNLETNFYVPWSSCTCARQNRSERQPDCSEPSRNAGVADVAC